MRPMNKISVVIADDHPLVRNGLDLILSDEEEIGIVGEASNGTELLQVVEQKKPDIIITDIKMPKMNGIDAVRKIKGRFPQIGIIVLSMYDKEQFVVDMMEAGALGYLLKDADKHVIVSAIKAVYNNELYYNTRYGRPFLRRLAHSKFDPYPYKPPVTVLTEIEKVIIRKICEGKSSKIIGDEMGYTERTVGTYRNNILEKLELPNAVALSMYAVKKGIYEVD